MLVLALSVFSAVQGMFLFGYNTAAINQPQKEIEAFINATFAHRYGSNLTPSDAKYYFTGAVTAFVVGGMVGALTGGWLADKRGRRGGILISQLPTLLGAIFQGVSKAASSYELLVVGRLLVGLSSGLSTCLCTMYLSEIAPVNLRGAIGTVNQLGVTCGLFMAMVLGLSSGLGSETGWPILLALAAVPGLASTLIMYFMPESPRYLILNQSQEQEGREALRRLRGHATDEAAIQSEVEEILAEKKEGDAANEDPKMSVTDLFKDPGLRMALLVCVSMHLSQQLSGIGAIFFYSTGFFEGAGISTSVSQYATICVGAIMVTMTFISIPLMERLGRRTLHLAGLAGIIICSTLIIIGTSNIETKPTVEQSASGMGIFVIVSTLAFVVFFAIGPGSIPWMCVGELFKQDSRGAASSVAVLINWIANLLVSLLFPVFVENLQHLSFLPFLVITSLNFAFLVCYFPETKKRSNIEISALFQGRNPWSQLTGFK